MKKNKHKKSPYEIKDLPIKDIAPDPHQPRDFFDQHKVRALAESIEKHGLLQPILVRPLKAGKYQLVHGERRYRACIILRLKTIRAEIRKLDNNEVLEIQIVENLQRENLNPIEEAKAFQRMQDELKYTHKKIAERLGKSREYVTNKLRLLSLPNDIQSDVARGKISEGHARALISLKEFQKQRAACREIRKKKLSVRKTEQFVQALKDDNVSRETSKDVNIEVKSLVVHRLVDGKETVDAHELESALICDLKTTRRLKYG